MAEYFKLPYTGVIDRPDLQELLLDEVGGDDTVLRDAAVKNWEELEDGTVKVNLEDGRSMEADVLVGADGI
eukprot:2231970-Rhodomonas_salina.1